MAMKAMPTQAQIEKPWLIGATAEMDSELRARLIIL